VKRKRKWRRRYGVRKNRYQKIKGDREGGGGIKWTKEEKGKVWKKKRQKEKIKKIDIGKSGKSNYGKQ